MLLVFWILLYLPINIYIHCRHSYGMASTDCYNCPFWSVSHYVCLIHASCSLLNYYAYIIITSLFFYCYIPILSTSCGEWLFKYCTSACLGNISMLGKILIACNMALLVNDVHTIYYHMNALKSVGLAQSYVSHSDYLVVWCWVCAVMFPDSVTPWEPHVFHFVKVFPWVVGHRHEGSPCHCIMVIIGIVHPFVITTFPFPWIVNICHVNYNISGLVKHPCNNCMFFPLWIDVVLNDSMILPCHILICVSI